MDMDYPQMKAEMLQFDELCRRSERYWSSNAELLALAGKAARANRVFLWGEGLGAAAAKAAVLLQKGRISGERSFYPGRMQLLPAEGSAPGGRDLIVILNGEEDCLTYLQEGYPDTPWVRFPCWESGTAVGQVISGLIGMQHFVDTLAGLEPSKGGNNDRCTGPFPPGWKESLTALLLQAEAFFPQWAGSAFDLVGDGMAQICIEIWKAFSARAGGILSMWENSEDWHHINFFERSPQELPTVFFHSRYSPAADRMEETIAIAQQIDRPIAVFSDAEPSVAGEGILWMRLPDSGTMWQTVFMQAALCVLIPAKMAESRGNKQ